jgi:O-antigen/teichoic acid export membrane protein
VLFLTYRLCDQLIKSCLSALYQRLKQTSRTTLASLREPGSFIQNFAVSFSASAAVTAIGILLTPVVSRIYPPASYGQFAVFSSVLNNLTLVTTLTLPGALLLPKTRRGFFELVNAIIALSLICTGALFLFLLVGNAWVVRHLNIPDFGSWFMLLPFILLLANMSSIMGFWYIRDKAFRKRAGIDISTTLVGRGVTIGAGLLLHGTGLGLLFGELANRMTYFSGLMLSGIYRKVRLLWRVFSWRSSWDAVRAYKDFPLYVLPANYVNVLSAQVPIFMLTSKFGATVVGLYAFSVSLLEMPLNLVGSAIAPVFMQKATEVQHDDPDRLKDITLSLYNKMLYLGLLPFGFLTVFGDVLFRIVFGAKWEMAGMFTAYLGYYYIFKLTSTVTAPIYTVIEKQRYALISTVLLLVARAGGLFIGLALNDVNKALLLFGVGSLMITFLTDLHILYLLRAPVMRIAVRTVVMVAVTVGLMYGLRILLHSFLPKWI